MLQELEIYARSALESDFFAGGLALGLIGTAAALLRLVWGIADRAITRRLWISVTMDSRSPAQQNFSAWLAHSGALRHARRLRTGNDADATEMGPDIGEHWFWHDGYLCHLHRDLSEKIKIGHGQRPMETYTLRVLLGTAGLVESWIAQGARQIAARERRGPAIHILRSGYWETIGEVPRRALDTVLCDDDRIERLRDDVAWFYGAADWYARRGVPWRRGYLLHGPPGTGKSSVIRAIASDLDLDIATVDLGRAGLSDDELCEAMQTAPGDAVLAIEDVDAAFVDRSAQREGGISFSGLLNAIDGVAAQEGRALFLTTNHRERLDPALIRPGRADLHVALGPVGADTAAQLFLRFFPGRADLAGTFGAALDGQRVTPAALQGWLLANTADPARAATAAGLLRAPRVLAAE